MQPGLGCRVVEADGHDTGTDGNHPPLRADSEKRLECAQMPRPQLELFGAGVVFVLPQIDPEQCGIRIRIILPRGLIGRSFCPCSPRGLQFPSVPLCNPLKYPLTRPRRI